MCLAVMTQSHNTLCVILATSSVSSGRIIAATADDFSDTLVRCQS